MLAGNHALAMPHCYSGILHGVPWPQAHCLFYLLEREAVPTCERTHLNPMNERPTF